MGGYGWGDVDDSGWRMELGELQGAAVGGRFRQMEGFKNAPAEQNSILIPKSAQCAARQRAEKRIAFQFVRRLKNRILNADRNTGLLQAQEQSPGEFRHAMYPSVHIAERV